MKIHRTGANRALGTGDGAPDRRQGERELGMIAVFLLVGFQFLLIAAACSDLLSMTIPNWISALIILLFMIAAFVAPLPLADVGVNLLSALLILGLTLLAFRFGVMGGGDAKLATATTLWFGWEGMSSYLLLASALGGLLAVAIIALRRYPVPVSVLRISFISRLADEKVGVPYGIALAFGALLTLQQADLANRLLGRN